MTKLIVAIDTFEALDLIRPLTYLGIKTFKFHHLIPPELNFKLKELNCDWFYDRKTYDTKDGVTNICTTAFELGADFITVYANSTMLEAAMKTKFTPYQKILAVGPLTDKGLHETDDIEIEKLICGLNESDGAIMSTQLLSQYNKDYGLRKNKNKIIICPGIRQFDKRLTYPSTVTLEEVHQNHFNPATPTQAKNYGADYIVVGRPITLAPDPIHVAKLILDEIGVLNPCQW